ncbi:MAG: hypothetical protein JWL70_664 [Acidimicrobiia bacterium]|nr:hypothetical protein [Acidimicrobiia bacterium]
MRQAFADVCEQLGPEAPTLCEGWTTQDIMIHMNLIERRWDSWGAIALGRKSTKVKAFYDQLIERERARPWSDQLARIRSGPQRGPLASQWLRDRMMPREYLIHTEDIRRANGITAEVSSDAQEVAWSRLPGLAKRMFTAPPPFGVEVIHPDGRVVTLAEGAPVAQLRGQPLEQLLYIFNRTAVSTVEITGHPSAVAAVSVRDTSKFAQALPPAFP